jgi:hypothetical protein
MVDTVEDMPYYLPGTGIELAGFKHLHDIHKNPANTFALYVSDGDRRACPVCRMPIERIKVEGLPDHVFEISYKVVVDPGRMPPTRFELEITNAGAYVYKPCGCRIHIGPGR